MPSVLEPPGLDTGDGSLPDGMTVFPFSGGGSLVWDCTCVVSFAEVHLNRPAMETGTAWSDRGAHGGQLVPSKTCYSYSAKPRV